MTDSGPDTLSMQVAILAPTGRDAALTAAALGDAGMDSAICPDVACLVKSIENGTGTLLVAEEAIGEGGLKTLANALACQPPWSDLPVLLLTRFRADSATVVRALQDLGNVTLLERPVRPATLVSALRAALKARERQYQVRLHISERERTSAALAESEGRLRAIVQQAMAGIAQCDAAGRFLLVNPRFCEIVGYTREELLKLRHQDLTHPEDQERNAEEYSRHVAEQRGYVIEKRYVRKDGSTVWVRNSVAVLCDGEARSQSMVAVVIDVTERKQAEEALHDADRRKDEFLATLAHELRNPLAPIRNSLHILRMSSGSDPAAERVCDMMERQVGHLVRLVDDLMEVSRITRGKIELRREPVELAAVIRSAVEASRPLIDASRHQLAISLPADPLTIQGDPVRLSQVFSNLLNNAAKYMNDGGQIWLGAKRQGGDVLVSVRDTGIGIPAEALPDIFKMFTQVDRSARQAQGGLGIGLTLVRTLVEMHGGRVEAKSAGPHQGSEFIVRLPLSEQAVVSRRSPSPSRVPMAARHRVLVVDDNRDAGDSLGLLLRLLGVEVKVVEDGPSTLAAMPTYRPTVVLLDIGMPGMDGYEVARRIRQQPEFRNVMLIALTGWGQADDRQRTRQAGFDHHLLKPADMSTLESLLSSLGRNEAGD